MDTQSFPRYRQMTDIPPHVAWPVHLFRSYGLTQKADVNNIVPILRFLCGTLSCMKVSIN